MGKIMTKLGIVFQSTHPVRGATEHLRWHCRRYGNFNPRTPCGVRPQF